MKIKSFFKSLKWIAAVSRRFSRVDRTGRAAVTSVLATLGISFGVMTLIVVMSVMNGFQMSFIDSILEISSYNIRASNLTAEEELKLQEYSLESHLIKCCSPFYEAQALMTGKKGGANSVIIRAVDPFVHVEDEGFHKEIKMLNGYFNLAEKNSIILGSTLARNLGVRTGDEINLLLLSGSSDVDLFSSDRLFTVTGIFTCGYQEINSSYAFINLEDGPAYFGASAKKIWGIKLSNHNKDLGEISRLEKLFPAAEFVSWRNYNKSFFEALKIEKNMLMLLVALIFVVVAINIYNGMRRLVFERRSEIAILSALGGKQLEIQSIFIMRGFWTGALGALTGVILGLLISLNTDVVFNAAARIMYWIQYLFTAITDRNNLEYVQVNSSYSLYATIPARIFPAEIIAIALFGVFAPLIASWGASKNVLKMTVSEVLHNE